MSKNKNRVQHIPQNIRQAQAPPEPKTVPSLLDVMIEGREYGSIVDARPANGNLVPDLRRAIAELEEIRGRRCLCYVANVIRDMPDTSIHAGDHLPFNEMVGNVPMGVQDIDVFLVTPGGIAEQVTQFVDALRSRFQSVEFILPYKAMSAGTLWALSGERIWMDRRAFIGPVDPQVRSADGSLVPAQALITLVNDIQRAGEEAAKNQQPIPWTMARLLDRMDQRQLGHALTSTQYVIKMAAEYLEKYKFRQWLAHSTTGIPVTDEERHVRAAQVAREICDHNRWKAHGHAINREAAYEELQIKVDRIEEIPGLEKAVRRLWALFYYVFDKSPAAKVILSTEYAYIRNVHVTEVQATRRT